MAEPNQIGGNYVIELKINGVDLTKFAHTVRLTNTINSVYPIVTLHIIVENTNLILQELFGQYPISMNVTLFGEDGIPKLMTKFMLFDLNSNLNLFPKTQQASTEDHKRQVTMFQCAVLPCFTLMATGVNVAFQEPASLTPLDMLQQGFIQAGVSGSFLKFDQRGKNTDLISQILIPSMTVNKVTDYVHERFGLYNGPLFKYCNINPTSSQPELILKDYNQIMNDAPTIMIYQMPVGGEPGASDKIIQKCVDDKHFFTDRSIQTLNYANSSVISNRFKKSQIIHPEDQLSYTYNYDANSIIEQYSTSESKKLIILDDLKNIESRQCTGLKGFAYAAPYNQAAMTSRISDQMKNTFSLGIQLRNNLRINNLMQPGSVCELFPSVIDYSDFAGKYILKSSDIMFSKIGDNWETKADLVLFRSVRSK